MSKKSTTFVSAFDFRLMKKYLKYIITIGIFAVIYSFVGDQSLIRRFSRWMQIRALQTEKKHYESEIRQAETILSSLENTDSLERFARENHYMHAPDETVYVIDD